MSHVFLFLTHILQNAFVNPSAKVSCGSPIEIRFQGEEFVQFVTKVVTYDAPGADVLFNYTWASIVKEFELAGLFYFIFFKEQGVC